ncbi:MAG: MBL fold metallo-hydrolase [Candidatus Euphemobacter frigidus]|nr:MBL fold metallo-hydrolase [Candidatus Euphemobacter frigidus]MDP8276045.1 MBL fold metallo-hydrolase [Candidatus Euphemobacter frigidus]
MITVTFLGAARNVTGSRFIVRTGEICLLVDCGLFQERDLRYRNWEDFPVNPGEIDAVVLTHAHIDHCGYLPKLVREGFAGKIFCTPPTAGVARVALLDSAHIQEEDAAYKERRHKKKRQRGPYPEIPLYTVKDAEAVLPLLETVSYYQPRKISSTATVVFHDAGHIIGSSIVELRIGKSEERKRLIFSGDLGRRNNPLLNDPDLIEAADYVFVESTYGDRLHESGDEAVETLVKVITETAAAGGNIIIPTFAIERAQELLFFIKQLLEEGRIPRLPSFIDSPMAIDITKVYASYPEYLDHVNLSGAAGGGSPFLFPALKMTRSTEESKAINRRRGSALIMAGSGMCTGGRVKHHLVNNITRPESTVLFVGYQARGTLGRVILERPREVRILGRQFPVRARIEKINGFSSHADRDELMDWISGFKEPPRRLFVIHGEERASQSLARAVRDRLGFNTVVPAYLESYSL